MNNNKKILAIIPILMIYLFYLVGVILYSCGADVLKILHITSNWATGIGLIVVFIAVIMRFTFPPSEKANLLSDKFIFIFIATAIGSNCLMYHLHNIFNMSSVNNDLCDAGWNLVTMLSHFSILVLFDEYLKLRAKWKHG
jgi:hypothetical protein